MIECVCAFVWLCDGDFCFRMCVLVLVVRGVCVIMCVACLFLGVRVLCVLCVVCVFFFGWGVIVMRVCLCSKCVVLFVRVVACLCCRVFCDLLYVALRVCVRLCALECLGVVLCVCVLNYSGL